MLLIYFIVTRTNHFNSLPDEKKATLKKQMQIQYAIAIPVALVTLYLYLKIH
jgi:hypothetical protein